MSFLDELYNNQSDWTSGSNIDEINNNLKKIAQKSGINSNDFEKISLRKKTLLKISHETTRTQNEDDKIEEIKTKEINSNYEELVKFFISKPYSVDESIKKP